MKIIRINGGKLLEGEVWIQGSKNASLAVIMASILTSSQVVLQNVPQIQDVEDLLGAMRKDEGRHFDIIWGISVKSEIPQGEATIFIVYAAD